VIQWPIRWSERSECKSGDPANPNHARIPSLSRVHDPSGKYQSKRMMQRENTSVIPRNEELYELMVSETIIWWMMTRNSSLYERDGGSNVSRNRGILRVIIVTFISLSG
jgi:hypothetical protein